MKKLIPINIIFIILTFYLINISIEKMDIITNVNKMNHAQMNEAYYLFYGFIISFFFLIILFINLFYLIYKNIKP